MTAICYNSDAHKAQRFNAETLPAIAQQIAATLDDKREREHLKLWLGFNKVISGSRGPAMLSRLHQAARAGVYKSNPQAHCDTVQTVRKTITDGGDCDQWAAVIIAALWLTGSTRAYLVSVGSIADPVKHVATAASLNGTDLYYFDPKPNQDGTAFNQRADSFEFMRWYQYHYSARKFSHAIPVGFHQFKPQGKARARTW